MQDQRLPFSDFYRTVFLPEHQHPLNVALHAAGTVASALWLPWVWMQGLAWLALLYPVVHAVPGLVGHRLFERSAAVGDVRVTREDYPAWWFIVGNHRMTWELAIRGFYWRNAA